MLLIPKPVARYTWHFGGKIGLLLETIAEFGESSLRSRYERTAGRESGDEKHSKSAREQFSDGNGKLKVNADGNVVGGTTPKKEDSDGSGQTCATETELWPISCVGYADLGGPRWVRVALAKQMERRHFMHMVDPDRLCVGGGLTSVLRSDKSTI